MVDHLGWDQMWWISSVGTKCGGPNYKVSSVGSLVLLQLLGICLKMTGGFEQKGCV